MIKLRQRRTHGWKWAEWLRRQLAWPLVQAIRLTHWQLSKLMLLSLEVAMEYMLALLHSPQVPASPLLPLSRGLPHRGVTCCFCGALVNGFD